MILTALGWLAALGLLAACLSSAWHGFRDKKYGPWIGAGLYACAAVVLLAIDGVLKPLAAGVLAFLALALAGGVALAEDRANAVAASPDGTPYGISWQAVAGSARGGAGASFGYLARDTRGLAGWLHSRWQELRTGEDSGLEPAPLIQPSPNGASSMPPGNTGGNGTRPRGSSQSLPPANGTVQQPAIRARRIAAAAGTVPVPAGWAAVVAGTADFEADSNVELAQWMTGQVLGLAAWAESVVEQHETNRAMGVDGAAISMLQDVAEAGVTCAQTMAGAVSQFCNYFELPDSFVDTGGQLAHDGRWHQGSPG
jgi:hypothetical protein